MQVVNKIYEVIDLSHLKKKYTDAPKHLFPDFNHKKLSFEIKNTCTSFVNSMRRCCLNENSVKYLNVVNIFTNDHYQIHQVMEVRINQISLLQAIDKNKKFILHAVNNTANDLEVFSKDIKIFIKHDKNSDYQREHKQEYKQDFQKEVKRNYNNMYDSDEETKEEEKEYESEDNINIKSKSNSEIIYFNKNIKICTLRSNCSIKIEFDIKENTGFNDGKYSLCCDAGYDILDANYDESTVNQDNKHLFLSIESFGNIEPQEIIHKSCKLLSERLEIIKQNLIKDRINIIKNNKIIQYQIMNEAHTISNLLSEYIHILNPNIELVNIEFLSVPDDKFYLCIINENPKKVIIEAIDKIKDDLLIFSKQI